MEIGKYRQLKDEKKADADDCIDLFHYVYLCGSQEPDYLSDWICCLACVHAFLKLEQKRTTGPNSSYS
jgi:hypothetical protein